MRKIVIYVQYYCTFAPKNNKKDLDPKIRKQSQWQSQLQ